MSKININGITRDMTVEEQTQFDNQQAQAVINQQAETDAQVIADAKKASGKQKLKDLGLDDDEIKQLTGA